MRFLTPLCLLATGSAVHAQTTRTGLSQSERTDLHDLHKTLVDIESITGNELAVGEWLATYLSDKGFSVEKQEVQPNRYNIYAWGGTAEEKGTEKLLITSHIDTVPPYIPYKITNNKITGRGTNDAKGSVATQVIAALSFLEEHPDVPRSSIGLLYVVGEEVDGAGMRFFSSSPLNTKNYTAILFGEPTEQKLVAGHKGGGPAVLNVTGRAAHSGYPQLGLSAVDILVRALDTIRTVEASLPEDDFFGNNTINAGLIAGGVAANVVAPSANATLVFRLASPNADSIYGAIERALRPLSSYATENGGALYFTRGTVLQPVQLDCDIEYFQPCEVVNYGTDIARLEVAEGTRRYLYGPGSILTAHTPREFVMVEDLESAVGDTRRVIESVLL